MVGWCLIPPGYSGAPLAVPRAGARGPAAVTTVGWKLEDIGYVFQPTRERSHVLTDSAQIEGRIIGIYTFRRGQAVATPPPPPG